MSLKYLYVSVVSASLALSACTSRAPQSVQIEQPKKDQPATEPRTADQQRKAPGPSTQIDSTVTPAGNSAELPITIKESDLKAAYANLDTKSLKYRFTYVTSQDGDLLFTDGKASVTFKNLPTGQTSTLKFEILEAGVVKFEASQPNFTLNKGVTNRISLQLKAVGGNGGSAPGPDSTDLQIDVSIAGQSGGSTPPPSNPPPSNPPPSNPPPSNPPPSNPPPANPPPSNPPPANPPPANPPPSNPPPSNPPPSNPPPANPPPSNPPADPIADWDGKSFKGNAKWNIVPVGG